MCTCSQFIFGTAIHGLIDVDFLFTYPEVMKTSGSWFMSQTILSDCISPGILLLDVSCIFMNMYINCSYIFRLYVSTVIFAAVTRIELHRTELLLLYVYFHDLLFFGILIFKVSKLLQTVLFLRFFYITSYELVAQGFC